MDTAAQADIPTAIDPVCGMTVKITDTSRKHDHKGVTYHFCGEKCRTRFQADPYFFLSGNNKKRGKLAVAGVKYTCPMDPEIISDKPGACPICGMALEPMTPSDEPSAELADFTRRMLISAACAAAAGRAVDGADAGAEPALADALRQLPAVRAGDTGGASGPRSRSFGAGWIRSGTAARTCGP